MPTITIDCFQTLVDSDKGVVSVVAPYLANHGHEITDGAILKIFAEEETKAKTGQFINYRKVLRQVMRGFGFRHNFSHTKTEIETLENSIADWPIYPDVKDALERLSGKYRLNVIANLDDDLFMPIQKNIGVKFDHIVTSKKVGSYKPSLKMFRDALNIIATPRKKVMHISGSIYHDIAPAKALGLATAWVNRSSPVDDLPVEPDVTVPDLLMLCDYLGV